MAAAPMAAAASGGRASIGGGSGVAGEWQVAKRR